MHEGLKDAKAGLKFCSYVREKDPFVPIIIESSDTENSAGAAALDACFLDKNSKKLPVDLRKAIMRNFGFGDFEFINPQNGEVIMRIKELKDLQKNILSIPAESLLYHASRNHISRWLYSRALFPLAEFIRRRWPHNLDELPEIRQEIFDSIVLYRKMKNRGVVAIFERNRFDKYSNFARIGQGSLGGKGRGLAFIDSLIKRHPILEDYEGISVSVPKTVVLCTDLFDEFMESNNLYQIALSDMPDEEILNHFLEASLPERLKEDILAFFRGRRTAHRRAFVEPARRLALPTFRRCILDLHDTVPRRSRRDVSHVVGRRERRICLGILLRQQSLHDSDIKCHRSGKNGNYLTRSSRYAIRRPILSLIRGCRPVAQLLPDQRRKS